MTPQPPPSAPAHQTMQGHQGFKQFMIGFKSAFPNFRIAIKNQVVTEDSVVTEFIATGTHRGRLMTPQSEIAPTVRTFLMYPISRPIWLRGRSRPRPTEGVHHAVRALGDWLMAIKPGARVVEKLHTE